MRKIITTTFITLDGVMQAPGGSKEDTSEGFKYGGWQMDWAEDDVANKILQTKIPADHFDLLLGHRTYDIFAGFWPKHTDEPLFGKAFDDAKKYVVAHRSFDLAWDNSELITGNIVAKIKKLKNSMGPDLSMWGSSNLIQTLLKNNLIDRMHFFTYPVTLGNGKKLFAEGTRPQNFTLVDGKITPTGIIFATYEPSASLKTG